VKSSNAPNRGVESGDSFTYTITVTNTGTGTAQDVVVTDTVPVGLTIEDVDGPGCSSSGRNVTCNVGDLAAGASATITITVTATDEACPEVRNRANAGWTDPDGTPGSEGSNAVDTDVVCVGGETVTPTPDPPQPTTVTPPGGTAFTGANDAVMRLGALAVALLVIGSGLTFAGYRRRTREDDAS
jgi:uncharacterized repeat protein (TIGR01451 family)